VQHLTRDESSCRGTPQTRNRLRPGLDRLQFFPFLDIYPGLAKHSSQQPNIIDHTGAVLPRNDKPQVPLNHDVMAPAVKWPVEFKLFQVFNQLLMFYRAKFGHTKWFRCNYENPLNLDFGF